jgi:hypothetical protein
MAGSGMRRQKGLGAARLRAAVSSSELQVNTVIYLMKHEYHESPASRLILQTEKYYILHTDDRLIFCSSVLVVAAWLAFPSYKTIA